MQLIFLSSKNCQILKAQKPGKFSPSVSVILDSLGNKKKV